MARSFNVIVNKDVSEAGENLSALRVVKKAPDGKVYLCDSSDQNDYNKAIGITTIASSIGDKIEYILWGELSDLTWSWNVNEPIYFDSQGKLTQTPGSVLYQEIAIAQTTTNIFVKILDSIKR